MYALSQKQQELRDHARHLVNTYIEPRADEIDRSGQYPHDIINMAANIGIFSLGLLLWKKLDERVGQPQTSSPVIRSAHM